LQDRAEESNQCLMFRSPPSELRNGARFGSHRSSEPGGFSSLPIFRRCTVPRASSLAPHGAWNMFAVGSVFVLRQLAFNQHAVARGPGACLSASRSLRRDRRLKRNSSGE
jgi:hypothetical protein